MIVVRTETWTTKSGTINKAVVRDLLGRYLGATNQTANVPTTVEKAVVIGKR